MAKNRSAAFSARKRLIAVAIAACFTAAPAWSNPTGPQVVNGSATFAQTPKLLTVTNSNGAIINWNKFSIGANETTRFNQASANSSILNRVLANDPSVLLGALSSNGRVWLVNPAGIMVGQGARIDVAAFVASTLNVRNEDFLAGRLNFGATPNAGKVENRGQITTPSGGSVYLVAPAVENHGIINAPNGEVILAAGQTAQLIDTGTPGVKVDITGAEGNVTNLGAIVAEAGRIGLAGVLVKNSGTLNASSLVKEGGRIFLKAGGDAYVDGAGRIDATGTKGGSIEVLGNRIAVMDQARLDASGDTGGGTVLVGGDYQGKNPDVQNATITYFGPDARIKADATRNGDGGKVILWADDTTRAYGNISARGGADGGNGGFVETSGKRYLDVSGIQVDARGVRGTSGTWLLDPNDISIISGTGSPGAPTTGNGNTFVFDTPGVNSQITDGTINATLDLGTDVQIKTHSNGTSGNGDILMTANAAVSTISSNRKLKLEAERNIDLQGSIGTTSTGSLTVEMSAGVSGTGKVITGIGHTLTLNGAGGVLVAEVQGGKSWDNSGTINLQGNSQIHLFDGISYATFNNLGSTGQFNSSTSANFAFFSLNDLGTVNNDSVMAIKTNSQSFESIFNQGTTGTLNIADTNFLNLQNAVSLSGAVNLNASGALNINENHGTPASLSNMNFPGAGGTLSIGGASLFPGKTATLSNVNAPNVALTVGSGSIPGVINIVDGYAVFKSVSLTNGGTLGAINNGTLGIASGDFIIPNGVSYSGNVGYFAAGNLTVSNPVSVPGSLNLGAGWDGNITNPGTTNATGTVTIGGNLSTSAAPMSVSASTDVTMGSSTLARSSGGTINYKAKNGSVQLGLVDAGAGIVNIVAGTNIKDGNGALANNIKAGVASLVASSANGVPGSIDVDTQVSNLFVVSNFVPSTPGQLSNLVTVRNSGSPLAVGVFSDRGIGQLTVTNDNSINVGRLEGAANAAITASGASSDITTANAVTTLPPGLGTLPPGSGTSTSVGNVVLNAGRDILVTGGHADVGGSISATAGRDIRVSSIASDATGTTIHAETGIDLTMKTGGFFIDGTLSAPASIATTAGNINVATSTGFTNNAGAGALSAPAGRWLIYAPNPASVTKNGLASAFRHYNGTLGNYGPGSVTESGDGFIYASAAGNLTVTTNLASGTPSNTYGVTPTASFGFSVAGFADSEDSAGNIGLAGTAAFTPTLATKTNAGNYTVAYANGLTSSVGYGFVAGPGVAYTVNQASLTLAAVGDTKVYDGTIVSRLTPSIAGLVSGDTVTGASQSFGSRHALGVGASTLLVDVGNGKNVVNDGNGGNNYIVTTQATNGTITPAPLTVSAIGQNKVYDGTSNATVSLGDNRFGSDALVLAYGSAVFNDKNAGTAKPVNVSGITLTGADSGDYRLSGSTAATTANITVRPLSTWIGGATGNWSAASNWDALPDLSNVLAVSVPAGKSVTYDAAAGSTNLASLTAAGLSIAGGSLTIANSLTVNSSFSQTGGTLAFGGGASASITQASGNLNLPAFTVANLSLNAPAGAITQSGRIAAVTLTTQSQGATTLDNPGNQISGRVDMTAGGPLKLSASGDLNLGAINTGANPFEINASHDVIIAAGNVTATNSSISAGHDISAEFTGDLRLNGSGFTAGNDIFVNLLGTASTLYLNDTAGLPRAFLWAQAPSTIHLDFPARSAGGMVVDGAAVNPLTFAAIAGASGLFYGAAMTPATIGTGLKVSYATNALDTTTAAATVSNTVIAAVNTSTNQGAGPQPSATLNAGPRTGAGAKSGADQIGGTEDTFGGSSSAKKDEDKDKKDADTGLKKQADKPTAKKLATCS